MGIRDWPTSVYTAVHEDVCAGGARRYVLEGRGSVTCDDGQEVAVAPNSLITVSSDATLRWTPSEGELVLLTPEYQGPLSPALVAGGFVLLVSLLVLASTL